MRHVRIATALVSAVLFLGCAGSTDDSESTGSRSQLIVGGKVATMYPEAAYLDIDFTSAGGVVCSASLIAPKVILTAGHCVDTHAKWTAHVGSESRTSTSAVTYDWNEKGSTSVNPLHHDIGLVFLDTAITIATYPTLASSPLANGSKVTNVGRINNGTITNQLYMADTTVTSGASVGYPYDYASSDVIQPGDSGGPDFASGTHDLVSVNSGAGGNTEVLARVDLVRDWILAQINAHGGTGSPSSNAVTGQCPADAESNDTFATASALPSGSSCGTLTTGDEDWFTFSAAAGATFSVALSTNSDGVFALGLTAGGTCTAAITGLKLFSGNATTAGTYCVRVTGTAQGYTLTRN